MVYVLEDDESIRELICYSMNKTGESAQGFRTPSELDSALERHIPDLILLDIMLPEEDGLSILARLRREARTKNVPVIMLTAKSSEHDKVTALDSGADDYVTKPFGVMELLARVKAVLRRTARPEGDSAVYTAGPVTVRVAEHEVRVEGELVELTFKEFSLLTYLLENRGTVLDRDRILTAIWGYSFDGENRTVDVHIRTLRQKLGSGGDIIETVRGVGYKIASHESRA